MRFAENINDLSAESVRCRGLGHSWKPYTAKVTDPKLFKGYNVTLVCENNCGTMKHFMLSFRGEYYPAIYTYGDDYLLEKGNRYISKEDKGMFKLQALSEILPASEVTNIATKRGKKGSA